MILLTRINIYLIFLSKRKLRYRRMAVLFHFNHIVNMSFID